MDLDTRIRNADPASDLRIPAADLAAARSARHRMVGDDRRGRYLASASGAFAAAAAVLLAILVIPGGPGVTPTSAGAAALERAGQAAQNGPTLKLAAGQYLYSEVFTLTGGYYVFGAGNPAERAYIVQPETIQTWEAPDGSDREVWTYDGGQQFATNASWASWLRAGQPPIAPPSNTPSGQEVEYGGPGVLAPPDDLSRLPTDPAALAQLIDSNETGLNEVTSDPTVPVSPAYTFSTAARILATPAFGSSPALRTALYQVMADVPGIELLGRATDQSGRTGTEIAGPLGGNGYGQPGGDAGVRDEVIVDSADGAVLEFGQVIAEPSLESAEFRKFVGNSPGQLLDWTDYLASGVVDSPSASQPDQPTTASHRGGGHEGS